MIKFAQKYTRACLRDDGGHINNANSCSEDTAVFYLPLFSSCSSKSFPKTLVKIPWLVVLPDQRLRLSEDTDEWLSFLFINVDFMMIINQDNLVPIKTSDSLAKKV